MKYIIFKTKKQNPLIRILFQRLVLNEASRKIMPKQLLNILRS